MKKPTAGKYNKRIIVQRTKSSLVVNAAGHLEESDSDSWETYCERWCKMTHAKTPEQQVGGQQVSYDSAEFVLRYDTTVSAIDATMRVVVADKVYSVATAPVDIEGDSKEVVFRAVSAN